MILYVYLHTFLAMHSNHLSVHDQSMWANYDKHLLQTLGLLKTSLKDKGSCLVGGFNQSEKY